MDTVYMNRRMSRYLFRLRGACGALEKLLDYHFEAHLGLSAGSEEVVGKGGGGRY